MIRKRRIAIRSGAARDSQRSKVYAAEDSAKIMIGKSQRFATIGEVADFANRVVLKGQTATKYNARRSVGVVKVNGNRCKANADCIWISTYGMSQWIVLHELAHTIHRRNFTRYQEAGHGWRFCQIYLELVREFLGAAAARDLKERFVEKGVKFRQPRERAPLTEAQKEALRLRLAAARAAKAQKAAHDRATLRTLRAINAQGYVSP